jgi:hypothetical protein
MTAWTAAFVQRLRELGWIEGRTIGIEYRWGDGRSDRLSEIAAEFVQLKVDVIVTREPQSPQSSRRPRPSRARPGFVGGDCDPVLASCR